MVQNIPYINLDVLEAGEAGDWFQTEFNVKQRLAQFTARLDATYHIINVENRTYTLTMNSRYPFNIEDIVYKTNAGTCTLAVQINGVNVGGLSALSVTSTEQTTASTSAKAVAIGDDVTIVVTSVSGATDLFINVWHDRTGAGTA